MGVEQWLKDHAVDGVWTQEASDLLPPGPRTVVTRSTLGSVDLSINDLFSDALLNYVLYRCYSKDADFAHNANLAAGYLAACNSLLGVKAATDVAYSPDANDPAGKVTAGAQMGGA